MKDKTKKILKIIGCGVAGAASVGIGFLLGRRTQTSPEISKLQDKNMRLEVEKNQLARENIRLTKRLESVIYHLGKVVDKFENKSYQTS